MPIRPLSSELQKVAESEINEVPSRVQADINHIREWISKQPHIRARTDDQWLLAFLRGCKFSLERTKEKLDVFYTIKAIIPEFFANRDPLLPEIQKILELGIIIILPKPVGPAGPRILLVRGGIGNTANVSVLTTLKVVTMIIDILFLEDDNYTVAGGCAIADIGSIPYFYMTQLTPDIIKKGAICFQEAYATRIKGIHALNTPSFVMAMYHATKMLINAHNRDRIYFYNDQNVENLYKVVPRSLLPTEHGGEAGSCQEIAAYWKNKIESYRDWFLEDARYGTDESKRPGKPKTAADMFGVEGSFRKLDVD